MTATTVTASAALPLAPTNPLPFLTQVTALRRLHTGLETLRDAGGPVTRLVLAPKWMTPTVVIATSPRGAHDILGRGGQYVDKTIIHQEMRHLLGPNLFDLNYEQWLPRRRALQPVFTKQNVRALGSHMTAAAELVAGGWADGTQVDLDCWFWPLHRTRCAERLRGSYRNRGCGPHPRILRSLRGRSTIAQVRERKP